MILLGLKLILAHIVGDFLFQSDKWVKDKVLKKEKSPYLYLHILVHAVALCLVLQFNTDYWGALLIILISHYLVDITKLYLYGKASSRLLFFLDQLVHLAFIGLVVFIYEPFILDISGLLAPKILLLAIALLLISIVSSIIIKVVMASWRFQEDKNEDSLSNAGKYIGILERLFVFVFIIMAQWQAIGFLIAAKSVFRFGDLSRARDRKLTEYILIGTLISFGLAILIGVGYIYLEQKI